MLSPWLKGLRTPSGHIQEPSKDHRRWLLEGAVSYLDLSCWFLLLKWSWLFCCRISWINDSSNTRQVRIKVFPKEDKYDLSIFWTILRKSNVQCSNKQKLLTHCGVTVYLQRYEIVLLQFGKLPTFQKHLVSLCSIYTNGYPQNNHHLN